MQRTQTATADPMTDARDRLNIVSFLEEVRGTGEPPKQKVLDAMSAVLTNERGGLQLYQAFSQQASDPDLKKAWKDFAEETNVHIQVCERAISALGGDPSYKSPAAKELEKTAQAMLNVQANGQEGDVVRLGYMLQAETICKRQWKGVNTMARRVKDPAQAKILMDASRIVERDEDMHVEWNAAMYDWALEQAATRR